MRIIHANTHAYGGAAVVARRLHEAALAEGCESRFITKYGSRRDPTPNYMALEDARLRYFLRSQAADARVYKLGKLAQRLTQHRQLAGRAAGLEVFSPLNSRPGHQACADAHDPDVVHLHWIAGFLDHVEFFERNRSRKFVWTLHDMNPFTGGCHHADGCLRFTTECGECPQLVGTIDMEYASQVLAAKEHMLAPLADDQLVITAPSRWLLELSMRSRIARRFRHVHIENPTFAARDTMGPSPDVKRSLGLPLDRKIALFVADNLRNPRKGFDLLFAAAQQLSATERVHWVGLGQRTDAPAGVSVSFVGRTTDERMLARFYATADVLVHPAMTENASLVMIEALSCGTPVVAFASGGTPELVTPDCGVLVSERSAAALAAAVHETLFDRSFARDTVRQRSLSFEPARVFAKYRAIYEELVAPVAAA